MTPNDRGSLAYWISQRQSEPSETAVIEAALLAMSLRDIKCRAEDADMVLGLTAGTTAFFNHSGMIDADAVLEELRRRNPEQKRRDYDGRAID